MAAAAGLRRPTEGQTLFPQRVARDVRRKPAEPDWGGFHQELQTHKNLTLQLICQEKREGDPDVCAYSRFCDLKEKGVPHVYNVDGNSYQVDGNAHDTLGWPNNFYCFAQRHFQLGRRRIRQRGASGGFRTFALG